jgi:Flp pilus assembly protein TadB
MERIPSRWRYTVFAFIIWLCLVGYILWSGNVYGYIIIALFGVFILAPALVIVLGNRGKLRRLLSSQDEPPAPHARGATLVPLEQSADPHMLN